jgi:hypothetical protein
MSSQRAFRLENHTDATDRTSYVTRGLPSRLYGLHYLHVHMHRRESLMCKVRLTALLVWLALGLYA